MLEELQRRNDADSTGRYYLRAVEQFARHFTKSSDKLGLEHLRTYQAHLLKHRKQRLVIADLKPPAVFGRIACVGQWMYHRTAEATVPSRIRALSRQDMDQILHRFPNMTHRLLDLVCEHFLHVLARLEDASLRLLIPRLARLQLNRAAEDVVRYLKHKEIA